jgi:predicted transposase YbfD/YdcC
MGKSTKISEIMRERFSKLKDKRFKSYVKHKLTDVLIIAMLSILCGIDNPEDISVYGKSKKKMLKKKFDIREIPSKSTVTRVLNMVNGDKVADIIIEIMQERAQEIEEILACDGKAIRGTVQKGKSSSAMQIITAYLTKSGAVMGQEMIGEKTNEIPILRAMLQYIDIKGKIITADSLHCQSETCRIIVENGGNYVIGLKKNQKTLYEEAELFINDPINAEDIEIFEAKLEKNGGRLEKRTCYKIKDVKWLSDYEEWSGIKSIFAVKRVTITKEKKTEEINYYITSLDAPPEKLLHIVREHWKIESMHWMLDVVFSEDECRVLSKNGQKTLNIFRKFALLLHKRYMLNNDINGTMKKHMLQCLLDEDLLFSLL